MPQGSERDTLKIFSFISAFLTERNLAFYQTNVTQSLKLEHYFKIFSSSQHNIKQCQTMNLHDTQNPKHLNPCTLPAMYNIAHK